jgi:hypothetical protein
MVLENAPYPGMKNAAAALPLYLSGFCVYN